MKMLYSYAIFRKDCNTGSDLDANLSKLDNPEKDLEYYILAKQTKFMNIRNA